ncbi:MAG: hypothetical protein ACRED5_20335 [Propylenella sp.]
MAILQILVTQFGAGPFTARLASLLMATAALAWWGSRSVDPSAGLHLPAFLLGLVTDYFAYAAIVHHIGAISQLPTLAVPASYAIGRLVCFVATRVANLRKRSNFDGSLRTANSIGIRELAVVLAAACAVGLSGNYALNALLAALDKEPLRSTLRHAFEVGDLQIASALVGNSDLGVHQTTDCLIFDMASQETIDPALYLLAGARTEGASGYFGSNCAALRDRLIGDTVVRGSNWYLRYLHGDRAVAILLLKFLSVRELRVTLKASCYGIFGLGIVMNLLLAVWPSGGGSFSWRPDHVALALIGVPFLTFFGIPYFGQSITMAPAAFVVGLFLMAVSVLVWLNRLTERTAVFLAIGYGLLTAYFEFLTGYAPVGACVLLALGAIIGSSRAMSLWQLTRWTTLTVGAFASALIGMFALHQVVTAAFHPLGKQILLSFLFALSVRMGGTTESAGGEVITPISFTDLGNALLAHLPHLGVFGETAAFGIILASLGLCLFLTCDILVSRLTLADKACFLLASGSFLPVGLWILLFKNHTVVHSSFMVRLLVVIPLAAFLSLYLWAFFLPRLRAQRPVKLREGRDGMAGSRFSGT